MTTCDCPLTQPKAAAYGWTIVAIPDRSLGSVPTDRQPHPPRRMPDAGFLMRGEGSMPNGKTGSRRVQQLHQGKGGSKPAWKHRQDAKRGPRPQRRGRRGA